MAKLTDSIDWSSYTGKSEINVFFGEANVNVAVSGDSFATSTTGWSAFEKEQAMLAFQNFSQVANVRFNVVDTMGEADFAMLEATEGNVSGSYGYWRPGGGNMNYGGATHALDGWGVFNSDDDNDGTQGDFGDSWSISGLAVGGYGYITLIHEIGHGMGLAHPHDSGGGSDVMQGVTSAFDDYGDFDLNQGVFTTMSYNDGWVTAPHVPDRNVTPSNFGYGWQGTLMAIDIAELQERYGANMNYMKGDNTYVLPSANGVGTYYSCLWDAGGRDTIRHDGAAAAVIDLRAATLDYSATGGGVVSYVNAIYGGFTIANGVIIENATGGSGDDLLRGNSAANVLDGRQGADSMFGGNGNDIYMVDAQGDIVSEAGATGVDTVRTTVSYVLASNVENCALLGLAAISATGNGLRNSLVGNNAANVLKGLGGNDVLNGGAGGDWMYGGAGNDTFTIDNRADRIVEASGQGNDLIMSSLSLTLADHVENLILTGRANLSGIGNGLSNAITGNAGNNMLKGGSGSDVLKGGGGGDKLSGDKGGDKLLGGGGRDKLFGDKGGDKLLGGGGADIFFFKSHQDSTFKANGRDFIDDFSRGQRDKINLKSIDADATQKGNQKFDFIGNDNFDKDAGELRFQKRGGDTLVTADRNGDGKADFSILVDGNLAFKGGDFVL